MSSSVRNIRLKRMKNSDVAEAALNPHFDFSHCEGCSNGKGSFWFHQYYDRIFCRNYNSCKRVVGMKIYSYSSAIGYVFHEYKYDRCSGESDYQRSVCFIRSYYLHHSKTTTAHIGHIYTASAKYDIPILLLHFDVDDPISLGNVMLYGKWSADQSKPYGLYGNYTGRWKKYISSNTTEEVTDNGLVIRGDIEVVADNELVIRGDSINYMIKVPDGLLTTVYKDADTIKKSLSSDEVNVIDIGGLFLIQTMKPLFNSGVEVKLDTGHEHKPYHNVNLVRMPVDMPWIVMSDKYYYRYASVYHSKSSIFPKLFSSDETHLVINDNLYDLLITKGHTKLLTSLYLSVEHRYRKNDRHYKHLYFFAPILIQEYADIMGIEYGEKFEETNRLLVDINLKGGNYANKNLARCICFED